MLEISSSPNYDSVLTRLKFTAKFTLIYIVYMIHDSIFTVQRHDILETSRFSLGNLAHPDLRPATGLVHATSTSNKPLGRDRVQLQRPYRIHVQPARLVRMLFCRNMNRSRDP